MGAQISLDILIFVTVGALLLTLWEGIDGFIDTRKKIAAGANGSTSHAGRIRMRRARVKLFVHAVFLLRAIYARAWLSYHLDYTVTENLFYVTSVTFTATSVVLAYDTVKERFDRWESNKRFDVETAWNRRRDRRRADQL